MVLAVVELHVHLPDSDVLSAQVVVDEDIAGNLKQENKTLFLKRLDWEEGGW